MVRRAAKHLVVLTTLICIAACSSVENDRAHLADMFSQAGFLSTDVQTEQFTLRQAIRQGEINNPVWVVIAGDGRAYLDPFTPSPDPTPSPKNMPTINIAKQLARQFPSDTVMHLTRPCQFLDGGAYGACSAQYWTRHRYSEPVQNAYKEVLSHLKNRSMILVGWSGGGVIAAHMATHRLTNRSGPTALLTMASPLDLQQWTYHHHVSPLPVEDSPAQQFPLSIPHLFAFGAYDSIVPPSVAKQVKGNVTTAPLSHQDKWHKFVRTVAPRLRASLIGQ